MLPLTYTADWRSIGFLLLLDGLFVVQWSGMLHHWALVPITSVLAFIACIIKHNQIHCSTFASQRWNRAFEYLLSLSTGQSIATIIPVHNARHHAQSQTEQDFVRSSLVNFRHNWMNLLALYWSLLPEFHRLHVKPNMRPELDHRSLLVCVWSRFLCGKRRILP